MSAAVAVVPMTDDEISASRRRAVTARQQQVLNVIAESIDTHGRPPTIREIGAKMGIRSTNGVNDHLRALEKKGYLTRDMMTARGVRLSRAPFVPGAPGETQAERVSFALRNEALASQNVKLRGLLDRIIRATRDVAAAPDRRAWRFDAIVAEATRELAEIGDPT